jgi:CRISP-associated protein Cas1
MTILHIREQGAVVRRDVEQIKVTMPKSKERRSQVLSAVPVREVEQVIVYGNVQVTTQAALLLMEHEVDVIFLSLYGRFRGRMLHDAGSKFARLRHEQLRLAGDSRRAVVVAQAIVRAKLANQRNTLRLLAAQVNTMLSSKLNTAAGRIDQMRTESSRARDLDALRGFEGRGGAFYFEAVRALLDPAWSFTGRKYYPPPDPFNALLSFGYALLLKDVATIVQIVGLDPYVGCFHALEYGRPSLNLDLMEEFRPLAVDRPMLQLAVTGAIRPNEFHFTGNQKRPVELGEALIPKVIAAYEEQMKSIVAHPTSGNNTLRRCLELQTRIFARTVLGTRNEYEGLVA